MTSIPLWVETIERKQFRWIYLETKNFFSIFFWIFEICNKLRTFSKKDDPHSFCISEIMDPEARA